MLSQTVPATVPLGSQTHGTQPGDDPSDSTQNNTGSYIRSRLNKCHLLSNKPLTTTNNSNLRRVCHLFLNYSLNWKRKDSVLLESNHRRCNFSFSYSACSYSGGLNSCCSSCVHSWCTVPPPPPLCRGTVQSTHHIHPLAQYHRCHKHTADNPGSSSAPGCGNHDGKSHSVAPLRVPATGKEKGEV